MTNSNMIFLLKTATSVIEKQDEQIKVYEKLIEFQNSLIKDMRKEIKELKEELNERQNLKT